MIHAAYRETDAAAEALVGELTTALDKANAEILHRDASRGIAVRADGKVIDWSEHLPRPTRAQGTARHTDPASFAAYVLRHSTPETAIYADKRAGRFVAVFNGAPATSQEEVGQVAGFGDFRAWLDLTDGPDWTEWIRADQRQMPQRTFGEHVEGLAHTMVQPAAARMIEIATTLTAKTSVDYASRVRLDTGEWSFKVERETNARAGRGNESIEIPDEFTFRAAPWEGVEPVHVTARLRFRPSDEGVAMAYRILRLSECVDLAFRGLVEKIAADVGDGIPIFLGTPPEPAGY